MKKLLVFLVALTASFSAHAQKSEQYVSQPTIAALKAMVNRPALVTVTSSDGAVFKLSNGACAAADDIFQVQPSSGTTVCYTRMANANAVGDSPVKLGPRATTNPYAGPYPAWIYGLGGTGYYNTNPLATNSLYSGSGTISVANPYPYGPINTSMAANFAVGANRPGCVSGYLAPNQISAYVENGSAALCSSGDTSPVSWGGAGTYTATTFTPTTPIPQTATAFAAVGMWVRSNDEPAYNGQITSFTVNGSNEITQITVSNWYQINNNVGSAAGTPAGSAAYLNPQDKIWVNLPVLFLNTFATTGDVTNGSNVIANVASTAGIFDNGQFLKTGALATTSLFPAGTYIVSHTANSITVSENATGATTAGATLTISAGTQMNKSVISEIDIFSPSFPFVPKYISGSATSTSGSYTLTGVSNVSLLRPGLFITGSASVAVGTSIVSVNVAGNSVVLNAKATGTGAITFKAFTALDEGGSGHDCAGIRQNINTCFFARGNHSFSFLSYGAADTSFLMRQNGFAGQPIYGFRTDGSLGVHASGYDFAVTDGGANGGADTVYWGVTGAGAEFVTSTRIGAGAAITSSGVGGALGTNAFTSTAYLPLTGGTLTGSLNLTSASAFLPQITNWNQTVDANGPYTIMQKSRGSSGAGSAVSVSDVLGNLQFKGADTTGTMQTAAYINATTTSVGAGSVAASLAFVSGGVGGFTLTPTVASFAVPLQYGGVTLANSVTGTGSMALSASPTFTGTANFANITATNTLTMTSSSSFFPQAVLVNQVADANGPYLILRKGRASGTTTQSGDTLGNIVFGGYASDNSTFNGPNISVIATGAAGATGIATSTIFNTSTSSGSTEAFRYDTNGSVSVIGSVTSRRTTAVPAGGTAGVGVLFSSTSNYGTFFGSGAPTLAAARGSLYLRSDGVPSYNTNGTTGWGELAPAASPTFTGTVGAADLTATGTIRANTAISANGTAGLSVTTTVRASGGLSDCTIIFTFGIKTGGTC